VRTLLDQKPHPSTNDVSVPQLERRPETPRVSVDTSKLTDKKTNQWCSDGLMFTKAKAASWHIQMMTGLNGGEFSQSKDSGIAIAGRGKAGGKGPYKG